MLSNSSTTKINEQEVYVVISIVSGFKCELAPEDIHTDIFRDKSQAKKFMIEHAKKLYYDYVDCNYSKDKRETRPETEGSNGQFFYESDECIVFGEDKRMRISYRPAWGMITLNKETLH